MKKSITLLAISFFMLFQANAQVEIEGVAIPDKIKVSEAELTLQGAGVRSKYFFDLYVCSFFAVKSYATGPEAANDNAPMSMRLNIISSMITSEKMAESTREGFEKSLDGKMTALKADFERFISLFHDEIKVGDVFHFYYLPIKGLIVYKNNQELALFESVEFKNALFGIWLGDDPADDDLREELIGNE
jgi:hypothetical protein